MRQAGIKVGTDHTDLRSFAGPEPTADPHRGGWQSLHLNSPISCIDRMSKPPSNAKPKPVQKAAATIVDLQTQRRLRCDLQLTSADLAQIDVSLAIEAGLIKKPGHS